MTLTTAIPVIARMMRRLAVPGPSGVPSTAQIVASRVEELEQLWHHHARPFPKTTLTVAGDCADELRSTDPTLRSTVICTSSRSWRAGQRSG